MSRHYGINQSSGTVARVHHHTKDAKTPRQESPTTDSEDNKKPGPKSVRANHWWRGRDSNPRPLGYEPNELPLLHPAARA